MIKNFFYKDKWDLYLYSFYLHIYAKLLQFFDFHKYLFSFITTIFSYINPLFETNSDFFLKIISKTLYIKLAT